MSTYDVDLDYQAVRDRPFTDWEVERMRLLLSTFTDGSGQSVKAGFMPDYLAFERCTAIVLQGTTAENKGIFDVSVPGGRGRKPWGVSCKMTSTQPANRDCWFMELSNSAKKFADAFAAYGVDWTRNPEDAGPIVVETVESWHYAVQGQVDVPASKYLLLTHDSRWRDFEIASFDLSLRVADPYHDVEWVTEGRGGVISSLAGYIETRRGPHRLWQFYANSGGQLKYYPPIGWEEWRTGAFRLESATGKTLREKVEDLWPGRWPG